MSAAAGDAGAGISAAANEASSVAAHARDEADAAAAAVAGDLSDFANAAVEEMEGVNVDEAVLQDVAASGVAASAAGEAGAS